MLSIEYIFSEFINFNTLLNAPIPYAFFDAARRRL